MVKCKITKILYKYNIYKYIYIIKNGPIKN